ncbi:hypothetical protein vBAbaPP1_104 [Acinetobacter phage vB_AbaM_P1]|nr:hypothetical protein Liucustia_86 [Acinetobacter phage Liucustia]UJE34715.1 hypothetical protein vBAbaPP1_104 [Acinetobacter phage vB_AbaM_P1]WAX22584.1 hypothetical protein [Acinetobacter phage vB_AbaP_HB01]
MTNWVRKNEKGNLYLPKLDYHAIVAIKDRDGESVYHENVIHHKEGFFVKINDGIGEVVDYDKVEAYFSYEPFKLNTGE